ICPALFDLGESAKVDVASVAEGDDKPEKYPYMFQAASLVILNKCDLLPHVPFDADRFEQIAHQVNPDARVIRVSATRGDNLDAWYDWLRERRALLSGPYFGRYMPHRRPYGRQVSAGMLNRKIPADS